MPAEPAPRRYCLDGNLSVHRSGHLRRTIEAAGVMLMYLPTYSPDFNPVEMAFAKLRASLRKAAE
jgi:transposase